MLSNLFSVNLYYTIYFNLRYFSWKDAMKLPVLIFGKVSVNALKGNVKINGAIKTGMIRFGEQIVGIYDKKLRTVFNIHGTFQFDGRAILARGSSISIGKGASLTTGDNFKITAKSAIIASGGKSVTFGADCLLSWDVLIMNTDFHKMIDLDKDEVKPFSNDIHIGHKVWIGCGVKVLKGAQIPSGSIVAAGSIVTGKLTDESCIYAGAPARMIRPNTSWKE